MRLRPGHWVTLDCLTAALCELVLYGVLFRPSEPVRSLVTGWHAGWVPPLVALCLAVPVALRRRWPVPALTAVLAAGAVTMALGGQVTRLGFVPMMLVLYLVAATSRRAVSAAGLAACLGLLGIQGLILHLQGAGGGNAAGASLLVIISWMAGYAVRQRRAYAAHLRAQAAGAAVTGERLRIARELHDVVAHSMTVVAVQAGFGEYVFDSQPAEARASLGAIQAVTREALADMQRLLGVLRQTGTGPVPAGRPPLPDGRAGTAAPLAPAPGLGDLERLVTGTAGAGVKVDLQRTGQVRDVPAAIGQSAFRIVQEALTNVVRHAGADRCQVTIGYGRSDLSVEITDPGPAGGAARPGPAGAGHGITGMRERVSLCGGEFSAGPVPGGGFGVLARFPLAGGGR